MLDPGDYEKYLDHKTKCRKTYKIIKHICKNNKFLKEEISDGDLIWDP